MMPTKRAASLLQPQPPSPAASSAQAMGDKTRARMSMTQGNGQGVGCIDLGLLSQLEQEHDHHHDLLFIGAARSGYCLFDLGRSVFGNLEALFGSRDDGGTASLPQLQRGVGIAGHEHLFDPHRHRTVGLDNLSYSAIDNL